MVGAARLPYPAFWDARYGRPGAIPVDCAAIRATEAAPLKVGIRPERTAIGVQDDALLGPSVDHGGRRSISRSSFDRDRQRP